MFAGGFPKRAVAFELLPPGQFRGSKLDFRGFFRGSVPGYAIESGLPRCPAPILGGRLRVLLPPLRNPVVVQEFFNDARIEDVERDLPGASPKFHRTRSGAWQATVLQPPMSLRAGDLQDVLDLTRDHGKRLATCEDLVDDLGRSRELAIGIGRHPKNDCAGFDFERFSHRRRQVCTELEKDALLPDRRAKCGGVGQCPRFHQPRRLFLQGHKAEMGCPLTGCNQKTDLAGVRGRMGPELRDQYLGDVPFLAGRASACSARLTHVTGAPLLPATEPNGASCVVAPGGTIPWKDIIRRAAAHRTAQR